MNVSVCIAICILHASLSGQNITSDSSTPQQVVSEDIIGARGNWVRKREWLKETLALNDQIQEMVITIQKSRTTFLHEHSTVDGKSNEFFTQYSINAGTLDSFFDDIKADIEIEKKDRLKTAEEEAELDSAAVNHYDAQAEAINDEYEQTIIQLRQFEFDVTSIQEIDASLTERLNVLDKQIESAAQFAQQASQVSEQIWHIIDDQKAREKFYELSGIKDSLETMKVYVTQTLLKDFKQVISQLLGHIERVKGQVSALEEEGLVIQRRVERLQEKQVKREEELAERTRKKNNVERKKKNKKDDSWTAYLINMPFQAVDFMKQTYSHVYVFLFGEG